EAQERRVDLTITVERKYTDLIRYDSRARVRKLGLIAADSYIDITPGSPEQPVLPPGSVIPAQRATDVDKIIASGEDLVDNLVQISYSLKNVLQRVDAGEGLIGELTTQPETKERITDTLVETLSRTNEVLVQVQSGKGAIGKLIYDEPYAEELTDSLSGAVRSIGSVATSLETSLRSGDGVLAALLHDAETRRSFDELIVNLKTTTENLSTFSGGLSTGEGILPRLIEDREYADDTLTEFNQMVERLNEAARQLSEGEGTAGRLISDPTVYESINDILIGINESRLLRWLIRNRQQSGIEKRYDTQQSAPEDDSTEQPAPEQEETMDPAPPPEDVPPSDDSGAAAAGDLPDLSALHLW
ncbi:MAG: hypothetical protein KY432_09410, partial [Acidobacteria bacterium]|nr:hypothetical protein [Acidobacteriota bacterium]